MNLKEQLAAGMHDTWAGWMTYIFRRSHSGPGGIVVIPPRLVARWKRQGATPYKDLPAPEKASARSQAEKIMRILCRRAGKEDLVLAWPDDYAGDLPPKGTLLEVTGYRFLSKADVLIKMRVIDPSEESKRCESGKE